MKLAIAFILYNKNTSSYLPFFIESLKNQTYQNFDVFIADNSDIENNSNKIFLEKNYKNLLKNYYYSGENLGFAKAYNKLIKEIIKKKFKYIFIVNPDTFLKENVLMKMVNKMENNKNISSISPKILSWNFQEFLLSQNKKEFLRLQKTIDTCGINMKKGLRFFDCEQGNNDGGNFKKIEILGPSGAGGLYRLSDLEKVKFRRKNSDYEEYFDEFMFMYKEDCDLVYRMNLLDLKSYFMKDAIMYHDRSASAKGEKWWEIIKNRKNKNINIRKWSFLNQHILFIKHFRKLDFINKVACMVLFLKIFIFIILFEPFLIKNYQKILSMYPCIKK